MSDNLKIYSWKEIVENTRSPYNTYVFVGKRNTGKSKSVRNLIVKLLQKIYHHNIVLFNNTSFKRLNEDYKFLIDNPYAKVFPSDKKTVEANTQKILDHYEAMKKQNKSYRLILMLNVFNLHAVNSK